MACGTLQSIYQDSCKDMIPGIHTFYVGAYNFHSGSYSIATDANNVVTEISGSEFYTFVSLKKTGNINQTDSFDDATGLGQTTQTATLVIGKQDTTKRNILMTARKTDLLVIGHDKQDKYWLMGKTNGVSITGIEATSGTQNGTDMNGYKVTFTAMEPELASEVTGSIIAGLIVG